MKRKAKKLNFKKIVLLLLIFSFIIYFYNKDGKTNFNDSNFSDIFKNSDYKTIKLDENKNYSGTGQEKVKNKDGYFTTFTTIDHNKKAYKEYKQNGNSSWSPNVKIYVSNPNRWRE